MKQITLPNGKQAVEVYTLTKIDDAVVDGYLRAQYVVKLETWTAVYDDSLVDSEVLIEGTPEEVESYLAQNNIEEVIAIGL